jgi:hypothetical protein
MFVLEMLSSNCSGITGFGVFSSDCGMMARQHDLSDERPCPTDRYHFSIFSDCCIVDASAHSEGGGPVFIELLCFLAERTHMAGGHAVQHI